MSPTLFIYGFKPFGPYDENVTEKIINAIPAMPEVTTHVFDVVFDRDMFLQPLYALQPDVVIGLGMMEKASCLRLESRAVNQRAEKGVTPIPIDDEGSEELYCTALLPEAEFTKVTDFAGSYVCNFSMYTYLSQEVCQKFTYGFIHVPKDFDVDTCVRYLCGLVEQDCISQSDKR